MLLESTIAAIPATIAALAAWRSSANVNREVRTNNGKRAGEYIERLDHRIGRIEEHLGLSPESEN